MKFLMCGGVGYAIGSAVAIDQVVIAQERGFAQPEGPRTVAVTEIPGVVATGATWRIAWQGTDNADGIVGTSDGGLLFAQEQPNRVSKLDQNDHFSVILSGTHGAGSLTLDSSRRILAVERTCTDPGRQSGGAGGSPCVEPPTVAVLTPERKVLTENFDGKPLGRLNDLVADKKGGAFFTSGGAYYANPGGRGVSPGDAIAAHGC